MIVRVEDKLANLVLGVEGPEPMADNTASEMAVWDGEKLVRIPQKPSEDLSYLRASIPPWLEEMLLQGTMLCIDHQDWIELGPDVQQYIEVIKY